MFALLREVLVSKNNIHPRGSRIKKTELGLLRKNMQNKMSINFFTSEIKLVTFFSNIVISNINSISTAKTPSNDRLKFRGYRILLCRTYPSCTAFSKL